MDDDLAVDLPDSASDELGACLGIPGVTAHRAVFGDGSVAGATILVHGVLGAVGTLAGQLAIWGGATVIGTVRRGADLARTDLPSAHHVVALDGPDPSAEIRRLAGGGVDRVIEVAFSDNADLDAAVTRLGAVIAAYATGQDRSAFPFWPMLFNNLTIRLLGSDDFPLQAKQHAATDLTSAAASGALAVAVGAPLPLGRIAAAHDRVEAGTRRRVLIDPNA